MQYQVIAGPYRVARRYAQRRGWTDDQVIIVCRGHQLASLDPALISKIHIIGLHTLNARIVDEIQVEIEAIKALWPVPMLAAA